jgi:hypothetical protein
MADTWASEAATQLRERLERKNQQEALVRHQREVREKEAPLLWAEIRRLVKENCADLNREMGSNIADFQITQSSKMHVRMQLPDSGLRELTATFEAGVTTRAIYWEISRSDAKDPPPCECDLGLRDDKAVFLSKTTVVEETTMTEETPNSIATKMLDALIAQ